jgi:hypothetical protein
VLYVLFFGHCVVCPFSFGHCVVCPFSFGHCVVCPFSFGYCVVCPFFLAIVLSVPFRLAIVLSVLLRVTASDYLFGICKLFLFMTICYYNPATPSTKRAPTIRKLGTSWRYIGWVRGAVTNT